MVQTLRLPARLPKEVPVGMTPRPQWLGDVIEELESFDGGEAQAGAGESSISCLRFRQVQCDRPPRANPACEGERLDTCGGKRPLQPVETHLDEDGQVQTGGGADRVGCLEKSCAAPMVAGARIRVGRDVGCPRPQAGE